MNLLIALKLGINKSVKNNLLGNEMKTGNTTLSSVGYATALLLPGRYSLALSTLLGIDSLDTVNSVGDRQSGYCQLCWGTCSAEERLCQPLGGWGFMTWHPVPVTCNQKYTNASGELLGLNSPSGITHIQSNFKCFPVQIICKSHHYVHMQYVLSKIRIFLQTNW